MASLLRGERSFTYLEQSLRCLGVERSYVNHPSMVYLFRNYSPNEINLKNVYYVYYRYGRAKIIRTQANPNIAVIWTAKQSFSPHTEAANAIFYYGKILCDVSTLLYAARASHGVLNMVPTPKQQRCCCASWGIKLFLCQ